MSPRHSRLPAFVDAPKDHRSRIAGLRLGIVGAGSVGSFLVHHAARLGIRELFLVDRGHFKPESLSTHNIEPADVGQPKAARLAERYGGRAHQGPVEDLPRGALACLDLVVLATDNLAAEVHVTQRCLNLKIPLLQASVHGATLVAQVRTLTGRGPCLACGFSETEWRELNADTRYSCDGGAAQTGGRPTMSVSFLCATAADLAMMQVLRFALGFQLEDEVLDYCGYTHATRRSPLRLNPACPCDHTAWTIRRAPKERSLDRLVALAGFEPESVSVEGALFVESSVCDCSSHHSVRRFMPNGAEVDRCPHCGKPRRPHPFSPSDVPVACLRGLFHQPLDALGAPSTATVLLKAADRAALFVS